MGRTTQRVADEFGYSIDYLYDVSHDPLFVEYLENLTNESISHSTKKVLTVRALAADKSHDAMNKLVDIMNGGNMGIAVKAAHEILTFGGVKPPERTEIDLTSRQANKLVIADDSHVAQLPDGDKTDDDRLIEAFDDFEDIDLEDEFGGDDE